MQFNPLQQSFNAEVDKGNLPDLTRMMFPSNDPFAYPNQPILEFDSLQDQKSQNAFMSPPNMFMANGNGNSGPYDDLEGQLFGPLPPYLTQGPADVGMTNLDAGMNIGMGQQFDTGMGATPTTQMNFDEIFGGNNEEWNSMLAGDPGYRL